MNTHTLRFATPICEAAARKLPARLEREFFSKFALVAC